MFEHLLVCRACVDEFLAVCGRYWNPVLRALLVSSTCLPRLAPGQELCLGVRKFQQCHRISHANFVIDTSNSRWDNQQVTR